MIKRIIINTYAQFVRINTELQDDNLGVLAYYAKRTNSVEQFIKECVWNNISFNDCYYALFNREPRDLTAK